jgi:hypothetical protein
LLESRILNKRIRGANLNTETVESINAKDIHARSSRKTGSRELALSNTYLEFFDGAGFRRIDFRKFHFLLCTTSDVNNKEFTS